MDRRRGRGLASTGSPIVGAAAVDEVDHARRAVRPPRAAASCSRPRAPRSTPASRRRCCPSAPASSVRLPPIAVKLNGLTAKTKPSSGRYSIRFQTPGRGDRLLLVDPRHELDVEAPEVDQLAGRVDLGLVGGLRLVRASSPRSSVARHGPGEQLGRAEEDRGALLPRRARPVLPGLRRRRRSPARPRRRRPGGRRRGRAPCRAASPPGRCRRCGPPRRRSRRGCRAARPASPRAARAAPRAPASRARSRWIGSLYGRRAAEDPGAAHRRRLYGRRDGRCRSSATRPSGWGVGELWLDDGRARLARAAHAARARSGSTCRRRDASRSGRAHRARTSPASRVRFDDVELDLEWCTPFQRAARRGAARGPLRRDRHLRRARGARRAPERAARRRARSAPRTASPIFVPCHRVVAAGGLGSYGSLGVGYKRRLLELEGAVSLRTSARELAAIAPQRDCDRLAELSALFHYARAACTCAAAARSAVHLDLASPAVARRAFALLRAFGVARRDPHLPAPRVRAARPATSCTSTGEPAALRGAARGGRARRRARARSSGRRGASSARSCCRARLPARCVPRRRARSAAALAAPRDPQRDARRARELARGRGGSEGVRAAGRTSAGATRSRTRRASRRSRTSSRWPARATRRSRSRSAPSSARRGRARTGSRTPTTRTSSARAGAAQRSSRRSGAWSAEGGWRSCRRRCARSPSCACGTRRSRCASSRRSADPPATKAAAHRRLGALVRLSKR